MIVEWTHRWFAAISIVLVVSLVVVAWHRYRGERGLLLGASAALVVILAQAGLGAAVVITHLEADLVATHLTVAMIVLALLALTTVESSFVDDRRPVRATSPDRGWRWLVGTAAAGVLATIVLGATVHDQYVAGWPLIGGELVPALDTFVIRFHFAHRVVAAITLLVLVWCGIGAVRRGRPRAETMLVHGGAGLFVVNIGLGAAHVFTQVGSTGLVVAHIFVASLAWTALVAALAVARRADEAATAVSGADEPAPGSLRVRPSEVRP
jgi:heme a synthase